VPKQIDRNLAAQLWEHLGIEVTNTRVAPRQHRGEVTFVGYADFQILVAGIPCLQLCGNSIKIMGTGIHFDPKSEKGRGDRAGHYFPHWFPMTPEARAVLAEKVSRNPDIIAMCASAITELGGDPAEVQNWATAMSAQ